MGRRWRLRLMLMFRRCRSDDMVLLNGCISRMGKRARNVRVNALGDKKGALYNMYEYYIRNSISKRRISILSTLPISINPSILPLKLQNLIPPPPPPTRQIPSKDLQSPLFLSKQPQPLKPKKLFQIRFPRM